MAVRLEEPFWTQLEDIAATQSAKLGEIIWAVRDHLGEDEGLTGALRRFCVERQAQELHSARMNAGRIKLDRLLYACPSPCIMVDGDGRPQLFNAAARDLIGVGPATEATPDDAAMRMLTFLRPFGRVRRELRAGVANENICLSRRGRTLVLKATICAVGEAEDGPFAIFPASRT